MRRRLLLFALLAPLVYADFPNICVHCWYRIPNSKLDSSTALPGSIPPPGGTAYRTIFTAWGGAAFDADSNRLLVTGGGHGDYSGNEVYSFSMDSLKWFLLKNPSSVTTYNTGSEYYNNPADSQQVRSQHSKDRLQTCPGHNKLFYIATMDMYSDADAKGGTHKLDLLTKTWSRPDTLPYDVGNGAGYVNGTWPISGYDSVTDMVWYHGMADNHAWLFSIRCSDDSLAQHGGYWSDDFSDLGTVNEGAGVIDVKRRRLYSFGDTRARWWPLTTPGTNSSHTSFTPTGNLTIYHAVNPGLDYSYVDTTVVGYAGGDTVYTFNSVSGAWTAVAPDAANTVHPPAAQQLNGTFGRFRYVKFHNYFIYAHSADSAVYLYRFSADNSLVVPAITSQPDDASVHAPATATFTVTASGAPTPTYQWQKNDVDIGGATSASYTTPSTTTADDQSTYRCIATNSQGADTSNEATLTVDTVAVITSNPADASTCVGHAATFTVTASGYPTITYQWQKNGSNIGGATSASYTTPAEAIGDDGATFRCVATTSAGSATSTSATLSVKALCSSGGHTVLGRMGLQKR